MQTFAKNLRIVVLKPVIFSINLVNNSITKQ